MKVYKCFLSISILTLSWTSDKQLAAEHCFKYHVYSNLLQNSYLPQSFLWPLDSHFPYLELTLCLFWVNSITYLPSRNLCCHWFLSFLPSPSVHHLCPIESYHCFTSLVLTLYSKAPSMSDPIWNWTSCFYFPPLLHSLYIYKNFSNKVSLFITFSVFVF